MKTKSKKMQATLIVAVLLALIVAIFAMAGTTYAKYITTGSTQAKQATVAKWGYVVTVNADDLFGSNYTYNSTDKASTVVKSDGVAVKASSSTLAPGTSGKMTITIKGNAEVLSKISFKPIDDVTTTDIYLKSYSDDKNEGTQNSDGYYPVKWTVSLSTNGGTDTKVLEDAQITDVVKYFTDSTATSHAEILNKEIDPSSTAEINYVYTISWAWAFGTSDGKVSGNDNYDTILGNYSNGGKSGSTLKDSNGNIVTVADENISKTLQFGLTATIEQIQAVKS
jgi:hypothetical protein